jgi:hypothetical protein
MDYRGSMKKLVWTQLISVNVFVKLRFSALYAYIENRCINMFRIVNSSTKIGNMRIALWCARKIDMVN